MLPDYRVLIPAVWAYSNKPPLCIQASPLLHVCTAAPKSTDQYSVTLASFPGHLPTDSGKVWYSSPSEVDWIRIYYVLKAVGRGGGTLLQSYYRL